MSEHHEEEGGFPSWILWVGGLLLFNGLSYVFNWGFILW